MGRKPFNLHNHIEKQLRKVWVWWPPRSDARTSARKVTVLEDGKKLEQFECARCKKLFSRMETIVDHISPVVEVNSGFSGWDVYIKRLFCPVGNLQVLCKPCHKMKTTAENRLRAFDWRAMKNE